MKTELPAAHFVDKYLLAPQNPVTVSLIGAGGTGSQVLTALGRINFSLVALGHPGISVQVFDDDLITAANLGRQLFAEAELGLTKSVALVNRINRFFGTNWKAIPCKVCPRNHTSLGNIVLSCVDTVKARFDIAELFNQNGNTRYNRNRTMYWLDFGNSRDTGQVILSTVSAIGQPKSKRFRPVAKLPFITEEYKELLNTSEDRNEPSCSLAEALHKQDLFINTTLAALGSSLLWSMFREGMISSRGFFLNLKQFKTQPISVTKPKTKSHAKSAVYPDGN